MSANGGVSSAPSSTLRDQAIGLDGVHHRTAGIENLSVLLFWIAAGEFVTVAVTAYVTALSYSYLVLQAWPPSATYVSAALYIASLILLVSLAFRHYPTLADATPASLLVERHRRRGFGLFLLSLHTFSPQDH